MCKSDLAGVFGLCYITGRALCPQRRDSVLALRTISYRIAPERPYFDFPSFVSQSFITFSLFSSHSLPSALYTLEARNSSPIDTTDLRHIGTLPQPCTLSAIASSLPSPCHSLLRAFGRRRLLSAAIIRLPAISHQWTEEEVYSPCVLHFITLVKKLTNLMLSFTSIASVKHIPTRTWRAYQCHHIRQL